MVISIIIPVYNKVRYLKDCVSSCRDAIFSLVGEGALYDGMNVKEVCEVILVDDGSTDGSGEMCDEIADSLKTLEIRVVHQENAGPSAARNVGLRMAQGEYIAFIDADDLIHESYFCVLMGIMRDEQADVVQSHYVLLSEADRDRKLCKKSLAGDAAAAKAVLKGESLAPLLHHYNSEEALHSLFYQGLADSSPVKIYRRALIGDLEFPERFRVYEDLYFMAYLFRRARHVVTVTLPIYFYFKQMDGTLCSLSTSSAQSFEVVDALIKEFSGIEDEGIRAGLRSRKLSMSFNILRLLSVQNKADNELGCLCWENICSLRSACLRDGKMRLKNKIGILLSYLGKNLTVKVFSFTI